MVLKRALKNFLLLSSSIFISLLFAELFSRLVRVHNDTNPVPLISDKILPYRMLPNSTTKTINGIEIKINSLGYRDLDFKILKDDDTKRILFIGDSKTYGYGVNIEDSYPSLFRKTIEEQNLNNKYQIINIAHNGFNFFDYTNLLRESIKETNPDIVVFGIDISDFTDQSLNLVIRNGVGINKGSFWDKKEIPFPVINLLRNSSLYLTFGNAVKGFNYYKKQSLNPNEGVNDLMVRKLESQFNAINEMKKKFKLKVFFAYLPSKTEIDAGQTAYPEFNELIDKFSSVNDDMFSLNLLEQFKEFKGSAIQLFPRQDYLHPNRKGHSYYAEGIYSEMLNQKIID